MNSRALKNARPLSHVKTAERIAHIIGGLNFGLIFTFFTSDAMMIALESAKVVLFPAQAALDVVKAIMLWRKAYVDKPENRARNIRNAIVETIAGVGIALTVLASLTLAAVFAPLAPAIFTAILGAKSLYNFGLAIFYGVEYARAKEPAKKAEYKKLMVNHAISGSLLLMAAGAVAAVMWFGKVALAGVGIASGVAIAAVGVYHSIEAVKKYNAKKATKKDPAERELLELEGGDRPTNNADMHRTLGASRATVAPVAASANVLNLDPALLREPAAPAAARWVIGEHRASRVTMRRGA